MEKASARSHNHGPCGRDTTHHSESDRTRFLLRAARSCDAIRGREAIRAWSRRKLARPLPPATDRAEALINRPYASLDFLCDRGGIGLDCLPHPETADCAGRGAGTVSHRQSIWPGCRHDSRPLPDRVPRIGGRTKLAGISVSLYTAGPEPATGHLRTLS